MRTFFQNLANVRWSKHLLQIKNLDLCHNLMSMTICMLLLFPVFPIIGLILIFGTLLLVAVSIFLCDVTRCEKIFILPSLKMTPLIIKSLPSFVKVECHNGREYGSGIIVSERHILTARHVVEKNLGDGNRLTCDSTSVKLCYLSKNGRDVIAYRQIPAKIAYIAKDADVAVLTVPRWCRLRPTMRFSGDLFDKHGQRTSVGHIGTKTGFQIGYVKKWRNQIFIKGDVTDDGYELLTTAHYHSSRGDSGGPVFTKNCEIIGIHTGRNGTKTEACFLHIRHALVSLPDSIRQEILDDQQRRFS